MLHRLTTPTWVTFDNGATYYYVESIEDGYYDDDTEEWVAEEVTLKAERGSATMTLSSDCEAWQNATISSTGAYVDVRTS